MSVGTGVVLRDLKACNHLHIVSVIASFDCNRNIKPLYLRVGGESLKIANAVLFDKTSHNYSFRCEVMDGEYVKIVTLTYFANEALWAIILN